MLKIIKKLKIDYLLVLTITSLYYGWIQWPKYIGDPDGFYHAKMVLLLKNGQLINTLPWMQFSTLKDNFTDHHLLYHILIIPFTYFVDNPLIAIKIATVFFTVAMILVFYWLLKKLHVAWPLLFTLLFITLNGSNFRLALVKANGLSLLLLWLLIFALINKRHWLSVIIGFLFVWLYGGWPLAILVTLLYFIADKIYQLVHTNKLKMFWGRTFKVFSHKYNEKIKIFIGLLSGIFLGLVVNPYWPKNLNFYYQQIFQIGMVNLGDQFKVGGEWYGTNIMSLIADVPHIFFVCFLIVLILGSNYKKISLYTWFGFLLTLVFLLLSLKSRRYIEYFFPFALFFVACGFTDVKKMTSYQKIKSIWKKLPVYLKTYALLLIVAVMLVIVPAIYKQTIRTALNKNWPLDKFSKPTAWLKTNTPENSTIFHADWDEWSILFYENDHNYYLIGLDPTFMYNYDPQLQKIYIDITTGKIRYGLGNLIKGKFNAPYIFTEKNRHQVFIANLNLAPDIIPVYADEEVIIYQIK